MTTAQASLPNSDQLKGYAEHLPSIYRDVLSAFHAADPNRREGGGLPWGTVRNYLANGGLPFWNDGELWQAFDKLVDAGFLTDSPPAGWFAPTRLGEELIAVLTGHRATREPVPDLPKPNW